MITKRPYIYNKVKRVVAHTLLLPLSSFLFAGCSDFLDIQPMNEVVLEKFWKEKADVTSAANGCYEALASEEVLKRMCIWGELRSDNLVAGSGLNDANITEILKENLMPTNSLCDWSHVYNVINRCNIVCHYAPEVQRIDPNYTYEEMKATIAEMTAIRSLCYFYLIRTFRDVPYSTKPTIDDNQNFVLPASDFDTILDTLIVDLEKVKDDALRRTSQEKVLDKMLYVPEANNSRITRYSIYALLADLYLWKGDWDNCIKYCDMILDYKKSVYDDLLKMDQLNDVALFHNVPLILEAVKGSNTVGNAYTEIFGKGNSFESLFEIYYSGAKNQENTLVSSFYGNTSNVIGRLKSASFIMEGFEDKGKTDVFSTQTDCRAYENFKLDGKSYGAAKYARPSASFSLQKLGSVSVTPNEYRSSNNANWIVYRLTDVMLMKAEALIERSSSDFSAAFELINDVFKRANNLDPTSSTNGLNYTTYSSSKDKMEELLFQERQRELMFEGKRWFDLVRLARRDGNTHRLTNNVLRKHEQDINVIKVKLSDPNFIYFPYARKELKVNPLLHQNPAFNKGEEGILN